MDAAALKNLSRSKLVTLAKANKIPGNIATQQIISQLLSKFPDGVPYATPKSPSLVGRVKKAFNSITRSGAPSLSLAASTSPSLREPPAVTVLNSSVVKSSFPPADVNSLPANVNRPPSDVAPVDLAPVYVPPAQSHESIETGAADPPPAVSDLDEEDELDAPASEEEIKLLIADMATASANNKRYLAEAAAIRERTLKISKETATLRMAFQVERARRQRLETYLRHWRPIDTEWSYRAVWDCDVTVAPVVVGLENARGSYIMEKEVSTSDDETLASEWQTQHAEFCARRKLLTKKKADQRGVDVEMVSESEMESDEEEFYKPYVLRPDGAATLPERECYIHPAFFGGFNGGFLRHPDHAIGIPPRSNAAHAKPPSPKRALQNDGESDDAARYSSRARIDSGEREDTREILGETLAEGTADNMWQYLGGWRMRGREEPAPEAVGA